MTNTNTILFSSLIVVILTTSQVFSQATSTSTSNPARNEPQPNGDILDQPKFDRDDTQIITNDQAKPVSNYGNKRPGQFVNTDFIDDRQNQQPIQLDLMPDFPLFGSGGMPGFSHGGFFGGPADTYSPTPARPMFFLDNLSSSLRRHSQNFERQFKDLERRVGEGQDISYFNRNGVTYVRTCTTKRLSSNYDNQSKQPDQILPIGQEEQVEQQSQQQPQQPPKPAQSSSSSSSLSSSSPQQQQQPNN